MAKTQDKPVPTRPSGPPRGRPGGPARPAPAPKGPPKTGAQARADAMRERIDRLAANQAAQAEPQIYVVKAGDSLSKIAKALLGDANRWPEILAANKDKIKDADQISPGLELVIPKK